MAFAAHLDSELWPGRTSGKGITTKASHFGILIILGMDFVFHL